MQTLQNNQSVINATDISSDQEDRWMNAYFVYFVANKCCCNVVFIIQKYFII